jgi:hypothetical protein
VLGVQAGAEGRGRGAGCTAGSAFFAVQAIRAEHGQRVGPQEPACRQGEARSHNHTTISDPHEQLGE